MSCPYIFRFDLKSGPCRVTSICKSLEQLVNDPFYASPLPLGKGKILYMDSEKYMKNVLVFDLMDDVKPDQAIIKNRVTNVVTTLNFVLTEPICLTFDDFEPGFFIIELYKAKQLIHHFTLIKCFPLVVQPTDVPSTFNILKAIW